MNTQVICLLFMAVHSCYGIVCEPEVCARVRCAQVTQCPGGEIRKGECGCCDVCVNTLKEGDGCAFILAQSPINILPTLQCAKGLICNPKTKKCDHSCTQLEKMVKSYIGDNTFVPRCTTDGHYHPQQCAIDKSECFCVDKFGNNVGFKVSGKPSATQNCKCAHDQANYLLTRMLGKMYNCEKNGNYKKIQCIGSVCSCADENGDQLTYTPSVNIGQLDELKC